MIKLEAEYSYTKLHFVFLYACYYVCYYYCSLECVYIDPECSPFFVMVVTAIIWLYVNSHDQRITSKTSVVCSLPEPAANEISGY